MAVELVVPEVGESITEVQIGQWLKNEGEQVQVDQGVVEIESDKATLEVPAPVTGVISRVLKKAGETAKVGEVIAYLEEGTVAVVPSEEKAAPQAAPPPPPELEAQASEAAPDSKGAQAPAQEEPFVMPAARRALEQAGLEPSDVKGTGPGGRVLKEDVLRHLEGPADARSAASAPAAPPEAPPPPPPPPPPSAAPVTPSTPAGTRMEEEVPMSPMRATIARRLVEAQQTAALLTTFNEADMSAVIALRTRLRESFEKKYGVKLGFMSFFVKAAVDALKQFPAVNAEIRGETIVYRNYYDIGIAVGGGKGLVVPILRNAELMSFAEIEQAIADFAARAKENRIGLEELKGGTFSISNGGIYGSLLSTPIVNPPQSGILGLHAIQDRPVAVDGQVVIRPMMYLALTYDHRIVDGREAVSFLRRIKECIESPERMLLEI
jgi:2-oxoglutarate dehydrogenase E2 component (dihydrolipoamide succinyltransferase)